MDDLRERLDAAIGAGPDHPPVEPLLVAGHRALRRRRIVAVAGTVAVLALVGTTYAVGGGQPRAARDPQPVGQGRATSSASAVPTVTGEPTPEGWTRGEYIHYAADGELRIRPGVKVLDRVDDYLAGLPRYSDSVAMDVTFQGRERWVTAELMADGTSGSGTSEPSDGWADFRAWVADQAAANGADGGVAGTGYPELVAAMPDGTFGVVKGVEMIDQTTEGLPDGFYRAAYVELDGKRYFVLARRVGGGGVDIITIHAEPHGSSLDQLVAYARDKYASGEGVR